MTHPTPWHIGTWSSLQLGSGLRAAPRPGGYANDWDVPAATSHPAGGDSGIRPRLRSKLEKGRVKSLKGNSGVVRVFSPVAPHPCFLPGRGCRSSAGSRASRAGARAASCSPRNHRARAQGAARGWGTFPGRKWRRVSKGGRGRSPTATRTTSG